MHPQFLALLPAELQASVGELERLAECEIAVVPNSEASEFDSLEFGVKDGRCSAAIAYKGPGISRCAIVHEVLHLKRYWLDAAPMLRPTARRYVYEAQLLNDFIEHLIIIPEEQRFAETESSAHWSALMQAELAKLTLDGSAQNGIDVRTMQRSLMLQRAMMDIALPNLDHTLLYDQLRRANLFEASSQFCAQLRDRLDDTEQALIFTAQEFRYDLWALCIGRFNIRANPKSVSRSPSLA